MMAQLGPKHVAERILHKGYRCIRQKTIVLCFNMEHIGTNKVNIRVNMKSQFSLYYNTQVDFVSLSLTLSNCLPDFLHLSVQGWISGKRAPNISVIPLSVFYLTSLGENVISSVTPHRHTASYCMMQCKAASDEAGHYS